jgi:hypothetical protein
MTKAELIKQLQDFPCPDNWKVNIQKLQWMPGWPSPSEENYEIHQVSFSGQGEISIEFFSNDLPGEP